MSGRPKLAEGSMRCQARCSGAGEPSPGRGRGEFLAKCKKAPLVQRGDRLPKAVRGDCKAGQTHSTWFYDPARKRSMFAASRRSPPCAKGGQTVADGQGGLTAVSVVNDTSRRAWASSAKCPQSLSRRSPTAPFAQGSRLCCSAHNHPLLRRWARIAKQPLPGDGLSHPEHRGRAVHKAFSEFWERRLAA